MSAYTAYAYDTVHATYIHVRSAVHSCTLYKAYSYMSVQLSVFCIVSYCFVLPSPICTQTCQHVRDSKAL